jgi:hypothetical protein
MELVVDYLNYFYDKYNTNNHQEKKTKEKENRLDFLLIEESLYVLKYFKIKRQMNLNCCMNFICFRIYF